MKEINLHSEHSLLTLLLSFQKMGGRYDGYSFQRMGGRYDDQSFQRMGGRYDDRSSSKTISVHVRTSFVSDRISSRLHDIIFNCPKPPSRYKRSTVRLTFRYDLRSPTVPSDSMPSCRFVVVYFHFDDLEIVSFASKQWACYYRFFGFDFIGGLEILDPGYMIKILLWKLHGRFEWQKFHQGFQYVHTDCGRVTGLQVC